MLSLGQKVILVADRFEQNVPVGEYGFIIAYDRNADNVFDYIVRVPKLNRNFAVPRTDVEIEEVLIQEEVERVQREALIDFALSTRNEALFHRIMNQQEEVQEEPVEEPEAVSPEEFIRQVNLRAWI